MRWGKQSECLCSLRCGPQSMTVQVKKLSAQLESCAFPVKLPVLHECSLLCVPACAYLHKGPESKQLS